MNAYLISAGIVDLFQEYIDYWVRKEPGYLNGIVFANSRGQAKSIFAREHSYHIDFTDVKNVRLVQKNIDRECGLATDTDSVWENPALEKIVLPT